MACKPQNLFAKHCRNVANYKILPFEIIEWRRRCCRHSSSNGSPSGSVDDWFGRCCHPISSSNGSPSGSVDICVPTLSSGSPSGSIAVDVNQYGGGFGRRPKN